MEIVFWQSKIKYNKNYFITKTFSNYSFSIKKKHKIGYVYFIKKKKNLELGPLSP